jgi:alpha-galactosidase
VSVPLDGVDELTLVVTDAGDGINCDHADWADARLIGNP